jgi:hypothetical protein
LQEQEQSAHRMNRAWWFIGVSCFVATALASHWLMAMYLARPQEQLLRDLPVIENIELYRNADSVQFIRQLDESGLFDEEGEDAL